jgi:NAD(P)-dependent dehydrogenase (short-subunit alcohol dehydrogenase family)
MAGFEGKAAWVTGAGSGIGRATALALASSGAGVLCLDRDRSSCEAVAAQIGTRGGKAVSLVLDVTEEASWTAAVAQMRKAFGRLDIAVHAAGVAAPGSASETSLVEWRRVLAVNLDGVFLGTQAALGLLREHGTGGSIINVSSVSGLRALATSVAYCTSKAAVCMLTRCAAKECLQAGEPIRVNSICPGGVKTPLWRSMPFFQKLVEKTGSEEAAFAEMAGPTGRFAEPEEIAAAIVYLAGDEARFVTGTEMVIDGGFLAGWP